MTLKEALKENSTKIKKTLVVTGAVASVATIAYLVKVSSDKSIMLGAAMEIIDEKVGDSTELIANKIVGWTLNNKI